VPFTCLLTRWVILDRILCPEHYFFDFRDAVDHDGRRTGGFAPAPSNPDAPKMGDIYVHQRCVEALRASTAIFVLLATFLIRVIILAVFVHAHSLFACVRIIPQSMLIKPILRIRRWEYEQGFEASQFDVALDTGWVCPYDEKLLLQLYKAPAGMLKTDEDRMVRNLRFWKSLISFSLGAWCDFGCTATRCVRVKQNSISHGCFLLYDRLWSA